MLQSLYAIQSMQLGDYETALELFDKILQRLPGDPVTHISRGHALKTGGKADEAILSYRAAIDAQPLHCEAWYSLANLKTYRFQDSELETMLQLDQHPQLAGRTVSICSSPWARPLRIGSSMSACSSTTTRVMA